MLILISGAPAVGKAALANHFSGKIEKTECRNSADIPVKTGTERREVLEEWVKIALEAQDEGKDFVLFSQSQSPFGELLACPSAIKLNGISCLVLDCHDSVRVERYRAIPEYADWPLGMDTLCWAAFHRMHAIDPQWEQRVIVDEALPHYNWERWTGWQKDDPRWNVQLIDNTELSFDELIVKVEKWIHDEKSKKQVLIPENNWWE
jgi:hypothetical protein